MTCKLLNGDHIIVIPLPQRAKNFIHQKKSQKFPWSKTVQYWPPFKVNKKKKEKKQHYGTARAEPSRAELGKAVNNGQMIGKKRRGCKARDHPARRIRRLTVRVRVGSGLFSRGEVHLT